MTNLPTDHALEAHAQRLVADWPPLSPGQRDRLAVLLRPAATVALQSTRAPAELVQFVRAPSGEAA